MKRSNYEGVPAIVICTGPSLLEQREAILQSGHALFGVNNTFEDFPLDVWIACDPKWHERYSPVQGDFDKWHWDKAICEQHGYRHIPGRWAPGLSRDSAYIHYNHSSGAQALNLAVLYGCDPIYLAGFDMRYDGGRRHYFSNLSETAGEYPQELRKYSTFDGLIRDYEAIGAQEGLPRIINLTHDSGVRCFEFGSL